MGCGGDVSFVHFSFVSRVAPALPEAALRRIARAATRRNRELGLTGELRFEGSRFAQVIEGPCDAVMVVACDILADPRHQRIEVRRFEPVESRSHAEWQVVGLDDSQLFCALRAASATPAETAGPRIGRLAAVVTEPHASPRALADRRA
ncbi:BLUF domain-containing protein [Amaricoccus solimangrovi]|uniref:BLUF domain-containing protein n=1 Tax=Amaricoccus solimangrovi TaxID=2589815 RepID=A0A501WQR9_9RHOB|nr:BLUF domain-containing protein [Amaricoccus solimangrovi]TPE50414.1 hypothetical protein FJM51_11480 [Amaricoccus solimangrovi]